MSDPALNSPDAPVPASEKPRQRRKPRPQEPEAVTPGKDAAPGAVPEAPAKNPEQAKTQGPVLYRATAPCRVGRFRVPGETFAWPAFDPLPPYLELAGRVPETGPGQDRDAVRDPASREARPHRPAPVQGHMPVSEADWLPPWETAWPGKRED